jgi:adenosyl cobinamide kinase/adenosyl cobinamide phosphate guanylyltransferase
VTPVSAQELLAEANRQRRNVMLDVLAVWIHGMMGTEWSEVAPVAPALF